MRPVVSRLNQLPLPARALTAGAGFAALLSLALPAPGRGPRVRGPIPPPIPALVPAVTRPQAGPLQLTSLYVGPEPRVFCPGRRIVATFVTDDGESCHVMATARLAAGPGSPVIRWSVAAPMGFQVPVEGKWTGPRLDVILRRSGGNPAGLGGPLSLTVQARAAVNGQDYLARETVVQDEVDQLRQEYVDLERHTVPDRSEFIDGATFAARYGRRYPWLQFEDLNWSVNPNTRLRYAYAIIRPELVQGLDQVRHAYGGIMINSGYRNPVRQVEVHAPVRESLHQYGCAADLAVIPGKGRTLPNEVDWRRLAEVACSARAKWVEPLAASAPNSPGCHVHLDYRPGPVSSAPVRLRGQVVEAATGKPVAGALVLLGAMPAVTDANGCFGIRHVLSGGLHVVEVHAARFEVLNQPVRLVPWGRASVRLALREAVARTFAVEVARATWADRRAGLIAATLRVANTGGAEAAAVRLSAFPARATLVSQEPVDLGSLPAGAVRGVRVVLRRRPGQNAAALAVAMTYRGASGVAEKARVDLGVVPPGGARPALAVRVARKPQEQASPLPRTAGTVRPTPPPTNAARSRVSETPAPVEGVSEPATGSAAAASAPVSAKTSAPAGNTPQPANPAATTGSAPEPPASPRPDRSNREQNPAKPPSPPTPPAASGTERKAGPPGDASASGTPPGVGSEKPARPEH